MDKVRVTLIQRIYAHYRRPIFDRLDENYSFNLLHSVDRTGNIPQVESAYGCRKPATKLLGATYLWGSFSIIKQRPQVIIQEFALSLVNLYLSYLYCRLSGCKLIIWGHGFDRSRGFDPRASIADGLRAYFMRKSDAVLLYSDEVKKDLEMRFRTRKFFVARNTIQTKEREAQYKKMMANGKGYYRNKRGCIDELNLVYVARVSARKKVELLVDLAEEIKACSSMSFCIHVVGDGPNREAIEHTVREKDLTNNIRFYGASYDEAFVSETLFLSDFLVVPAWLGLSVNHAFCYGVPVATLKNEQHPPEIEFVRDMYNGMLCSDMREMARRIIECVKGRECIERLGRNARAYFSEYLGMSSMYAGFRDAIDYALQARIGTEKSPSNG